jgi:nucleoside triphosphate pyrophosphatase
VSAALVLASSSPQRRAILERLGIAFEVREVDVRELEHGEPRQLALENARRKAQAAARAGAEEVVLGCDTIVCRDGAIYGKPADEAAARETLRALGGATHEVLSGLVLLMPGGERSAVARTAVTFRELDDDLLEWYVTTGEWRGRSGGYAIQKAGAALVRTLDGECENVVGLPVATLLDLCPELLRGSRRRAR